MTWFFFNSNVSIEVKYHVQHEIVSGLKYNHTVKRKGLPVDKVNEMIGSYAPRKEIYTYKTDEEEAPSGFQMEPLRALARKGTKHRT